MSKAHASKRTRELAMWRDGWAQGREEGRREGMLAMRAKVWREFGWDLVRVGWKRKMWASWLPIPKRRTASKGDSTR
jgi:hypothetical protein